MRLLLIALAFALAPACTPPTAETAESGAVAAAAGTPEVDLGPYSNSWDSDEFSRFRHTLHTLEPGARSLTLSATTASPGGETVAIYPVGEGGEAENARVMFVVASARGETETVMTEIPAGGLEVEVVVENASRRRFSSAYTISVEPRP